MGLGGQWLGCARGGDNRGYAMAALLVAMSIMAVLMSALLPVWTHMATREKEEELIFRGNQYARAIGLFQRKFANTPPPTIDVLVEQRFLRKKYKDPITNDDFQPLYANQAMPTTPGGPSGAAGSTQATQQPRPLIQAGFGSTGATSAGGIVGVTSKSKDTSIKVYNGRSKYNEWAFVYVQTSQRPGQPGVGGVPNQQRPGQPMQPGQRGPQGQQGNSPFGMQPQGQRQSPFPNAPFSQPNRPPPPGMGSPFSPSPFGTPGQPPVTPGQPRRPGGQ
jgi:type II secretory pathway pseudopilin PulG